MCTFCLVNLPLIFAFLLTQCYQPRIGWRRATPHWTQRTGATAIGSTSRSSLSQPAARSVIKIVSFLVFKGRWPPKMSLILSGSENVLCSICSLMCGNSVPLFRSRSFCWVLNSAQAAMLRSCHQPWKYLLCFDWAYFLFNGCCAFDSCTVNHKWILTSSWNSTG